MKKLSHANFEKAKQFLKTQAMDIDRAMYEHFFEDKPLDEVLAVMETYQNDDGGFGTLDYDLMCPLSCMKHVESACRYIYKLNPPVESKLIQRLLPYMAENYNPVTGEWNNMLIPEVNDYPHAWWWEHKEDERPLPTDHAGVVERYVPNLNIALSGILSRYKELVPQETVETAVSIAVEKLQSGYKPEQYDMNSIASFVRELDDRTRRELTDRLYGELDVVAILDDKWGTENAYKLCNFIESKNHPYYDKYKETVNMNLDFLIDTQEVDGSWNPNWSWEEEADFSIARKRIQGLMTFTFLNALKVFGRIEM